MIKHAILTVAMLMCVQAYALQTVMVDTNGVLAHPVNFIEANNLATNNGPYAASMDQGVATTNTPSFPDVTVSGTGVLERIDAQMDESETDALIAAALEDYYTSLETAALLAGKVGTNDATYLQTVADAASAVQPTDSDYINALALAAGAAQVDGDNVFTGTNTMATTTARTLKFGVIGSRPSLIGTFFSTIAAVYDSMYIWYGTNVVIDLSASKLEGNWTTTGDHTVTSNLTAGSITLDGVTRTNWPTGGGSSAPPSIYIDSYTHDYKDASAPPLDQIGSTPISVARHDVSNSTVRGNATIAGAEAGDVWNLSYYGGPETGTNVTFGMKFAVTSGQATPTYYSVTNTFAATWNATNMYEHVIEVSVTNDTAGVRRLWWQKGDNDLEDGYWYEGGINIEVSR